VGWKVTDQSEQSFRGLRKRLLRKSKTREMDGVSYVTKGQTVSELLVDGKTVPRISIRDFENTTLVLSGRDGGEMACSKILECINEQKEQKRKEEIMEKNPCPKEIELELLKKRVKQLKAEMGDKPEPEKKRPKLNETIDLSFPAANYDPNSDMFLPSGVITIDVGDRCWVTADIPNAKFVWKCSDDKIEITDDMLESAAIMEGDCFSEEDMEDATWEGDENVFLEITAECFVTTAFGEIIEYDLSARQKNYRRDNLVWSASCTIIKP
jgi:hypothetical protein